jgi:hypothetical protein
MTAPVAVSAPPDVGTFLRTIAGEDAHGHRVILGIAADKTTAHSFPAGDVDAAVDCASVLSESQNAYFGVALQNPVEALRLAQADEDRAAQRENRHPRRKELRYVRGRSASTISLGALSFDLDIKGAGHAHDTLPNESEALAFIGGLPVPPSAVVHSGGGLHAYWLLKEPWCFETAKDRADAQDLLRRWQYTLISKGKERGWTLDNTSALAGVLRVPGTWNWKDPENPRLVSVVEWQPEDRYNPEDFEPYLRDLPRASTTNADPADFEPAAVEPIVNGCAWLRHCRDDAATLPEPEWYRMLSITARCADGDTISHEWSAPYPGYSHDETEAKIDRALHNGGPVLCSTVAETFDRGAWCAKCLAKPFANSPINLSVPRLELSESHTTPTAAVNGHEAPPTDGCQPDTRPRISVASADLKLITPEAWHALAAVNEPPYLFCHGDTLTRLERDERSIVVLRPLSAPRMRYELARCATFFTIEAKHGKPAPKDIIPPGYLVDDLLASPDPPLPMLRRVVSVPTFTADGALVSTPGYSASSGIYLALAPGLDDLDIPSIPSREDMSTAREILADELLADFPFVEAADQAHALALLLLPFARDLGELADSPTPGHMVEAPAPGSGKGLLADVLLSPSQGRTIGIIAEARDDDEWRKRITAALLAGRGAITVDNITRPLDSGVLSAALTATTWEDRILGKSEVVRLPVRCAWVATANNPVMSTEIARRFIRIRLDPRQDRPWQREGFRHPDLRSWASVNRSRIVRAALVLVQHWIANDCPPFAGKPLGSFEGWSRVIGGILESAGVQGFLANLDTFYEAADIEGTVWRMFVATWWERYQDAEITMAHLFPLARDVEGFELGRATSERAERIAFGKRLARQRDRVIGEYRVVQAGNRQRASAWRLLPTQTHQGGGQ